MDGAFYLDTREPFFVNDLSTITLATTDKAMYPKDNFPVLGGQYWARPGKRMWIHAFGKFTTGTTPGNIGVEIYYGSGADATGTLLETSAAVALSASQTNLSWWIDFYVHCTATGTTGALYCTGMFTCNNALIASTLLPLMLPASAAATTTSLDLTSANIISLQFKRSGSTAETATVQDLHVVPMN